METPSHATINPSVREIKTLTDALSHNIDAASLNKINQLVNQVSQDFSNDKVVSTAVKMAQSLLSYLSSKGKQAHQATLPLLCSVVKTLDDLFHASPPLSQKEKQARLSNEIGQFNSFKAQIQQSGAKAAPSSIADLKGIILSLDWEISDSIIDKLDLEVTRLKKKWPKSKIHHSFLQMFESIGQYVKKNRANTHPGAISLLTSLCKSFDQVVKHPNFSDAQRNEILSREVHKFNQLKQAISSHQLQKSGGDKGFSPMDDLIGTKASSNLSPVDDLIEEIHMLQDEGDTPRVPTMPASQPGSTNPDVKEVIPDRQKGQPLPEIESRLDAFFDEDEPMNSSSFADSEDEVVPYQEAGVTSSPTPRSNKLSDALDPPASTAQALDDISPTLSEDSTDEGVVPFDFEDDFFEEDYEDSPEMVTPSNEATSSPPSQSVSIDGKLLEGIKSKVAHSLFDGNTACIAEVAPSIDKLSRQIDKAVQGPHPNEPQTLVKLFKAFQTDLPLVSGDLTQTGIEGMLFCLDCLEHLSVPQTEREASDALTLSHACSRYIDFQATVLSTLMEGGGTVASSTMPSAESPSSNREESHSEIDPSMVMTDETTNEEPAKGFWAKLKRFFGG